MEFRLDSDIFFPLTFPFFKFFFIQDIYNIYMGKIFFCDAKLIIIFLHVLYLKKNNKYFSLKKTKIIIIMDGSLYEF